MKVPVPTVHLLRCPACHTPLRKEADTLICGSGHTHPIVDGVAILINEASSVFNVADYATARHQHEQSRPDSWLRRLRAHLPSLSANYHSEENYADLARFLAERGDKPRVLVLGGRILGQGMKTLADNANLELIESDVAFGPRVKMICDAHDIPFQDGSLDGIIIQAVLEHVCDPWRCVQEIHRVLKPDGLVYAETPFMQQVHGRAWDFTRFTDLGHRRLFRHFTEIRRGVCCGPGMALAWSFQYFLLSFTTRRWLRSLIRVSTEAGAFWLKYLDRFVIDTPGCYEAASGYYFLGKKAATPLPDRELVKMWRGIV